jgi:hypothetical protein
MTSKASAWAHLPGDLKALPQWTVAGASKAPLSVDARGKLFNTSVTRPGEWLSFEDATRAAWENRDLVTTHVDKKGRTVSQTGLDIGFMLHESDPFTCIDLDVKDATTNPDEPELHMPPERWALYLKIVNDFATYTEFSRSGKGVHLWVRGAIGRGFRRDGVEVYSQERFIICTGHVLHPYPIQERQLMLSRMVTQMNPAPKEFHLEEIPPEADDWYVLQTAFSASNSDKFIALWQGKWQGLGFPSQSEADLALMSMLTFYSPSNEQCRQLFRESALGKREKAVKDNRYLNATLTTIRGRMARESQANLSAYLQSVSFAAEERDKRERAAVERLQGVPPAPAPAVGQFQEPLPVSVPALHITGQGDPATALPPADAMLAQQAPITAAVLQAGETGLPWPPGFAGTVARYMYQAAMRPVKEVAIVAALGLLAGITGKAWHIPKSGLNLYIILIARSAIGKEAMHQGISEIIAACSKDNPMFHKFVDFTEYASGPALIKACVANPCFVNVSGEWGRKLKRLAAEDGRDGALQTLRTQMTNLYQKSGPQAIVGGIGYSSTDNNVASVSGVSYSLIGETTPGTFYEALTENMMEDGFLSRFLVIEYDGLRPNGNPNPITSPDASLRNALNNMATQADLMIAQNYSMPIGRTEGAAKIMSEFELLCDQQINGTNDESRRQMWNRAALKSLRVAGLLAVADNWMTPCINEAHITWAQDVVIRDIGVMKKRMDGGDVGSGDAAREKKMVTLIRDYITSPVAAGYKIPDAMRQNSIVPRSYLQVRVQRHAAFYSHKLGAVRGLEDTLTSLVASGYLMEVQKDKLVEAYNYHGKAYRVLNLPDYDAQAQN